MLYADVWAATAERRRVVSLLRQAAYKDLRNELRRAQQEAVKPLRQEIALEAAATLPGGYGPVLANAIRVNPLPFRGEPVVRVRIYARSRRAHRDLRAVNAGRLRHPLFGHRKYWYVTTVRPGVVARPVDRLADRVTRESIDAVDRVTAQITRG